ncbi:MAG: 50S ribosomal protein L31e [Candidatus Woesearchaeota archaeon]
MIERVYTIPLRKGFHETAEYKKTKKAVSTLMIFLSRHMKQPDMDKVYIGANLNKELWKHGIKNPPAKVKVVVIKEDNGDVKAELYGTKYDHKKKAEKEDKADTKKDSKLEEKAKESKKKSTTAETHEHTHEDGSVHTHEHNHEEKHEHAAGQTHEHVHVEKPVKAARKTVIKKKSE